VEKQSACHTNRFKAAADTLSPDLLEAATVDVQQLEARREAPDMEEGSVSELAAPVGGDEHATKDGPDVVT